MDMITQGFIAAATAIYLLSYIGFRRVFAFAFLADIIITGAFILMFSGSYAGMMTGVIAGLLVSFFIRAGRKFLGTEHVRLVRGYGRILPNIVWVRSK